jgi:hypothetical protein
MNKSQTVLASINVVGFVLITALAMLSIKFGNEWAMQMMQNILPLLIGCWISNFTTVINYVFGTSAGSAAKSQLISKMVNTNATQSQDIIDLTQPVK